MRIIIEVPPGGSQVAVESEPGAMKIELPEATDAGPPPGYLLDALGEAVPGPPALSALESSVPAQAQDAGGVPKWLVEAVEPTDQKPPL
jgi:hypothetical protein